MRFNKIKCKVLHRSHGEPQYQSRLGDERIENSPDEKDLRMLVSERLYITQQCAFTAQKGNCVLDCIKSSVASRLGQVILPLYSTLVRSHLEYYIQLWGPQYRKDINLLGLSYEEMPRELQLFGLEKRRLQCDLTVVFQYLKGAYKNYRVYLQGHVVAGQGRRASN
ncbi:hypothetical protein WISP_78101 [Willisornis vidua]|uniref:Uncharacterized protein n=1 Tax=Willisornis vidua TaxID=1566151 RepID=A0ABQ9DBK0_9PASS|nr:hypothetical protein WISP_78101 [Willisornis vidua]